MAGNYLDGFPGNCSTCDKYCQYLRAFLVTYFLVKEIDIWEDLTSANHVLVVYCKWEDYFQTRRSNKSELCQIFCERIISKEEGAKSPKYARFSLMVQQFCTFRFESAGLFESCWRKSGHERGPQPIMRHIKCRGISTNTTTNTGTNVSTNTSTYKNLM